MPYTNTSDKLDVKNNDKLRSILNFNKRNLGIIILLAFTIIAIPLLIYSTHALTPTPIKYTLLKSFDVNNLGPMGTAVTLPQGTKNIKIDYNISWETVATGTNGFNLDVYDKDIVILYHLGLKTLLGLKDFK